FLNGSVMGSMFTRYKTPAFLSLDFAPTFTTELLRKDFDLGLDAGAELGVPLPVAQLVRKLVQETIDAGHGGVDFAAMLDVQAKRAGLELTPDREPVSDGLGPAPGSVAA
ncbi:MAG: NAD-binding protein, partial [Gaiellales bacterium]